MFVILWFEVVGGTLAGGDKRVDRPEIALRPSILTSLNVTARNPSPPIRDLL